MTAGMGCFDLNNASDCVYLDDLVIYARPIGGEEYVVYETDFSSAAEQWENYWNLSGSSSYGYTSSTGHNGNGCMMIQGVTSYSILVDNEPYYIHLREGYEYKIAAWVKVESSSSSNDIIVYPQMVFNERQVPDLSGKKVEEGFSYSSGTNSEWLSVEDLRERLKEVELEK